MPPALASSAPAPRMARAPTPTTIVIRKNAPISATAQAIDFRAAAESGTVKKRIRMCGRPAVPSSSARPKDTELHEDGFCWPGDR